MLTTEIKMCQMSRSKEEKYILKIIIIKRKNCLNYLINHAEQVENISISREIFLN